MEIMYHKYSIRDFVVNDDNFAADIERAYTIGDMIAKKNWKDITIRLGNGIRADTVVRYPDFIRRYAGIGLNSVSLGIESVVQEVLDATQKDITLEQIDKAVSILKEHNLDYFLYLQVGLPNDRYENAKKVKEWVKRNDIKCFGVGLTTPYPKTALWDYIEKNGRFLYPKNEIYKRYPWHNLTNVFPVWETKEFSAEKRMRALTELRYFAGMRFLRYGGIIALFRHPAILEWARKWVRYAVFGRIFGKK